MAVARPALDERRHPRHGEEVSGFRLAVKDNIDVAGLPTTAGLQAWRNRIAQHDAAVVAALKKRGAVIVGKTLMDEAAFGALGDNPWYGRVHNPARHGYSCGGSSAGSAAAVASSEADLALGTDTLGSVRIPASYCGVVGYVPSAGRIDMAGVTPLAPSFDRVGFFTRTVQEMIAFTETNSGSEHDLSIRVLTSDTHVLHAASRLKAARLSVSQLGAQGFDWSALRRAMLLQIEVEAAPLLLPLPDLSQSLRAAMEFGKNASPERLARAKATMESARKIFMEWMESSLLLLPATPTPAFPFDTPVPADQADYATLSSLLGLPAISVPTPVAPGELPIGVQCVAPAGKDASLLATAALLA
jgi:aspartyl-tRNA(Asn)/glutamyl-tRNA(Gln) amidotransferase subunit A